MKAFLARHSITAKSFAGTWLFIVGLWTFSGDFRAYVMSIYGALPKGLHEILAGLVVPALLFWNTRRQLTASVDVPDTGKAEIKAVVSPEPNAKA